MDFDSLIAQDFAGSHVGVGETAREAVNDALSGMATCPRCGVLFAPSRANHIYCSRPCRRATEPGRTGCGTVPIEPFQRRFLQLQREGSLTARELARRMNWWRKTTPSMRRHSPNIARFPDETRVRRTLGLMKTEGAYRKNLTYEMAVVMARELGLDPVDCGI